MAINHAMVIILLLPTFASFGFAPIIQIPGRDNPASCLSLSSGSQDDKERMNCGLLVSSFSGGLLSNSAGTRLLQRGLAMSLLVDKKLSIERAIEDSVVQSPCCGPDISYLEDLEEIDNVINDVDADKNPFDLLEFLQVRSGGLRFVYIPTAMYALRPESNSSAGRQRQRSKADGRKRRARIENCVTELLGVNMSAITLDLNGGILSNPSGNGGKFPSSGIEALTDWKPHLVYVEGGNTFWLHHCIAAGDWWAALIDVCSNERQAVYVGVSAGAILAGEFVETACWKGWDNPSIVPGMEHYDIWRGVEGLQLVNTSVFPHMSDDWESVVRERIRSNPLLKNLITLSDEDVCFVKSGCPRIVGSSD